MKRLMKCTECGETKDRDEFVIVEGKRTPLCLTCQVTEQDAVEVDEKEDATFHFEIDKWVKTLFQ